MMAGHPYDSGEVIDSFNTRPKAARLLSPEKPGDELHPKTPASILKQANIQE